MFSQKHLLTLRDWSAQDIKQVLAQASELKKLQKSGVAHKYLEGQSLAMIFYKSSTRTRVSFEVGMSQLGGHALFLSHNDIQLGRSETIADTAQVLSRYVNGIMIRTFSQQSIEELAEYSSVPVINALTDDFHPCQVLADLMTIIEHKGKTQGLKLAFIGDGNNMANSLLIGCSKMGMSVSIASPEKYSPDKTIINLAGKYAKEYGEEIQITQDKYAAAKDADIIYTDVWTSMGQEEENAQRMREFTGYCVDDSVMSSAKSDAIFMHCLPAHRGEEVSHSVIDGKQSVVFDEAENRLHAQKAVMYLLMGR